MRRISGPAILLGGGALLGGVLAFGVSLGLALGGGGAAMDPSLSAIDAASTSETGDAGLTALRETISSVSTALQPEVLRLAVASAPFEESREPPARRYRLPEDEPPPPPPPVERPELPEFRLSGSVTTSDGGWALIQVGGGDPQLVAVGDRVSGFTLSDVEPNRAVISAMGEEVRVSMAEPAMTGGNDDDDDDDDNRGRNTNNQRNQGNQGGRGAGTQQLIPGLGAMLGGRGGAAIAPQLQQLIERLGADGGQIQINGNQVTVTRDGQRIQIQGGGNGSPVELLRQERIQAAPRQGGGE